MLEHGHSTAGEVPEAHSAAARTPRAVAEVLPSGFTTRFAPAPTGYLHLGHIVNAVWVWGLARARGGRVLLRIEDHDRGRCRPEYEFALLDDLDWLGLVPDGASTNDFRAGPHAQRQGDQPSRYSTALAALEAQGLTFACKCSRAEIARAVSGDPDDDGVELRYPGICRERALDLNSTRARRVRMEPGTESFEDARLGPQADDPAAQCGDLLVRDRDGNFTYQFAVVIDDNAQGVNVVIRGEDLLSSTARQIRLARLLGRGSPPSFVHHPLVRHSDGRKLSKSAGDTGVRDLRAAGRTPQQLLGLAAHAGGLTPSMRPLELFDLAELFA